ncbi:MAG TPA: DUF3187 family protein [Thermoanaerobaculia bacterium]|nr:DUF3187 family protein [Thermoanaerobaculia bacterium]
MISRHNQHKVRLATVWALFVFALTAIPSQAELLGPLRVHDMTPFNLLRLDMLPAQEVTSGPGSWAVEVEISHANTFVMSENVGAYLEQRDRRGPLRTEDVEAIESLGEDAYFVDGEVSALELTVHRGITRRSSVYLTLPLYDFTGGFLDGTVEGFHSTFGFGSQGRDLVARDRFQTVARFGRGNAAYLDPPVTSGWGDPVVGVRHSWPVGESHWNLIVDGAAKIAVSGERPFLSTGSHDFGLQASLQRKHRRQGIYLSASVVRTEGEALGVPLGSDLVPTVTAAYEVGLTRHTSAILQLYASEGAVRETSIEEIKANKYQASLGLRTRRGPLVYGFAVTENVANFQNTADIGMSLTLAWLSQ